MLKKSFSKLVCHIGRTAAWCFCVDFLKVAHDVGLAFVLQTEVQIRTSASRRDKTSTPHFSPLCFRSSSKGSMRMTSFRLETRPFSTFSIRTDAFCGVSQMTVKISALAYSEQRCQQIGLVRAYVLYARERNPGTLLDQTPVCRTAICRVGLVFCIPSRAHCQTQQVPSGRFHTLSWHLGSNNVSGRSSAKRISVLLPQSPQTACSGQWEVRLAEVC